MARLRAMDPDEAAALWTVRLAEGEHPHERDLFVEWLDLTPGNRDAWDRAQRGWSLFDKAADDELIAEMRRHAREARPLARRSWKPFAAAAAALLAVVGSSVLVERSGILPGAGGGRGTAPATAPATAPIMAASYTYLNGRELPRLVILPDGSRMTLDAQSRVTAQFSGNRRDLELVSGRAFFDVRHDASRPFTVSAANLRLVDIGTRFDVEKARDRVQVTIIEGRISVRAPGAATPVLLSAGDQLTAEGNGRPVIGKATGDAAFGWQNGFASFDNMKLSDAAAILNRYPGQTLIVENPRVTSLRVSGNFRLGDARRFGRALEEVYPVRVRERGPDQIEIVPAG